MALDILMLATSISHSRYYLPIDKYTVVTVQKAGFFNPSGLAEPTGMFVRESQAQRCRLFVTGSPGWISWDITVLTALSIAS